MSPISTKQRSTSHLNSLNKTKKYFSPQITEQNKEVLLTSNHWTKRTKQRSTSHLKSLNKTKKYFSP